MLKRGDVCLIVYDNHPEWSGELVEISRCNGRPWGTAQYHVRRAHNHYMDVFEDTLVKIGEL